MSINLSPITLGTTQFSLNLAGVTFESIAWLEFLNESPNTLTTQIGGMNIQIPAWYDYPIEIHRMINGVWTTLNGCSEPVNITPMLIPSSLSSNLSNTLLVTLYQKGQYPAIQTPQPLFRQGWIPNTVNSTGGTATSLQNDGNVAGTNIIEATPFGSISSKVTVDNSGNAFFGGAIETPIGITANQYTAEPLNDLGLTVPAGQKIVTTIAGTGHVFDIDLNGPILLIGSYRFIVGSISRVSFFTQAITNVLTAYNHGLGVVPDFVFLQLIGTSTTAATVKYDDSSMTSTQVKLISSAAAVTVAVFAVKLT